MSSLSSPREDDARRIMEVLPKRMSKYGLTVHPEKTRLVWFTPIEAADPETSDREPPEPTTFDFLGFTHYWGRSQKGEWVIKRKTAKRRLSRALKALSAWCATNRHEPIEDQHQTLSQKLLGHYGYYGIIGNYYGLQNFLKAAKETWRYWLSRRSRDARMSWIEFRCLAKKYEFPKARVVHGLVSRAAR